MLTPQRRCDRDSAWTFRRKLRRAGGRAPARFRNRSVSRANGNRVTRTVPSGIAGTPADVAMFLAPAFAGPSAWWQAKQESSKYSGQTSFLSKRSPFARRFPVAGHHRGERIEFKKKIGMSGGDYFAVDKFLFRAEVAFETFSGAVNDVARVVHAQRDGFFVWPIARGVWDPARLTRGRGNFRRRRPRTVRRGGRAARSWCKARGT